MKRKLDTEEEKWEGARDPQARQEFPPNREPSACQAGREALLDKEGSLSSPREQLTGCLPQGLQTETDPAAAWGGKQSGGRQREGQDKQAEGRAHQENTQHSLICTWQ